MEVDNQPSQGINSLLSDMMQGTNKDKERGNINLETRSPWKNKQRNDTPPLKSSEATLAVPEKSTHTKLDTFTSFPRVVVEASIKLSDANPFQEFVIGLQNLLKNGQLVDPLFAFCPINTGGSEKKKHEFLGIPINMAMLGAHFKISSNGQNPFKKQKIWGKGVNKNKEEFCDPVVYFTFALLQIPPPKILFCR
jgi:hypothetical protein